MKEVKDVVAASRERICKALFISRQQLGNLKASSIFMSLLFCGPFRHELHRTENTGLRELRLRECTMPELETAVGVVAGCAFYRTSFEDLTDEDNCNVYNFVDINRSRIREIITAFGVSESDIPGMGMNAEGSYDRAINSTEEAFDAVCCPLFHVNGMSFVADDDVTRQRGAQQTTLSNPLTNLILCSRYSTIGETVQNTLGTLLRRVQGQSDAMNCMFRNASTIYIDRGYVSDSIVLFLRDIGLHVIGTQKRGPQAPFTFGQGREYKHTKKITEFGILSAFWAEKRHGKNRKTFQFALREASTVRGRMAMLVTTREDLAENKWIAQRRTMQQTVQNFKDVQLRYLHEAEAVSSAMEVFGDRVQDEFFSNVTPITGSQSGSDKLWFLGRGRSTHRPQVWHS
ncbi:hypothetical protein FGB62_112g025 [Gracilaria domingensis]|nr:hypothetical protein FGB62_112g025 [Gracilaria domingensis]